MHTSNNNINIPGLIMPIYYLLLSISAKNFFSLCSRDQVQVT